MDLEQSRINLENINLEIFGLFEKRSKLVKEIQTFKNEKNLPCFDPQRERQLFEKLFLQFSDKGDLFFMQLSLLIESQARSFVTYPAWSKGEHLLTDTSELVDYMNPILLFVINKPKYQRLKLNDKFTKQLEAILK